MVDFIQLLAQFLAVMVVISFHEFAHAFAAYKCGDPTAKFAGRMTLNPFKHFDPFGIVMFVLVGFGWAKPVPVNPYNFDNYAKGSFWTSAAGIFVNYLMAFLFYPLWILVIIYVLPIEAISGTYLAILISTLFSALFSYSLSFAVFNLLPFYPLDGFRIFDSVDKKKGRVYRFLRQYGYYILMGLIGLSFLADILSPYVSYFAYLDVLGFIMGYATNFFGKPILLFWNWIFGLIY